MKKTLAAVAVLGAFAGSALAADVTLYGVVDLGFGYAHSDAKNNLPSNSEDFIDQRSDKFEMKSGQNSGSRIGFKGTEQLSDDVTVGFVLETGFNADTGVNEDAFFHRESRLFVQTAFGEIGLGRYGALDSTTGPYDLGGDIHATTGVAGVGSTSAIFLGQNGRHNNAITYKSPNFGGLTVLAQFASGTDDKGDQDYSSDSDRYYALGASYDVGALHSALVVSRTEYNPTTVTLLSEDKDTTRPIDDSTVVTAGVSYDFGVTKTFVAGQYYKNVIYTSMSKTNSGSIKDLVWKKDFTGAVKGYGVTLGADTPVFGGTLTTQVGYSDAETVENFRAEGVRDASYEAWNVGAIYEYPLSKRTSLYGAVGYQQKQEKADLVDERDYSYKEKSINAGFGMVHTF